MIKHDRTSGRRVAVAVVAAAVLIAVGGSALALPGKGSVDKNDLGKNVVTSKNVKKNALTGADIKERSLKEVPSAAKAGTATSAGALAGLDRPGFKRVAATPGANIDAARAAAPEVLMFTQGPFTVYGKCFSEPTATHGAIYIRTAESNSVYSADSNALDGNPFLNPGTVETDRALTSNSAGTNNADAAAAAEATFFAMAPSGATLEGTSHVFVKDGTLPGGDGIYGAGDACLFSARGLNLG